ncbi:MAG: tRNA (adenosine(37)-N6)-threonylcarbamoyltransferase complex ATPase subunit type 1 TsaE [Clostridia bacterium]|nr:tRNA (adenosine(37)-N6)-threonylcarbamoyltransferase complex ATPase subunit type 1 TsaE [Clostridia bacterium]
MTFPKHAKTSSAAETEALGAELAKEIRENSTLPRFIAMYGDLGVGKTAFVRGFASVLAAGASVKSPTYALVNQYGDKKLPIYHFDMYRIIDEDDLYSTGFYDYLAGRGICIAEWCENIPYALPEKYLKVEISKTSVDTPDEREISISLA